MGRWLGLEGAGKGIRRVALAAAGTVSWFKPHHGAVQRPEQAEQLKQAAADSISTPAAVVARTVAAVVASGFQPEGESRGMMASTQAASLEQKPKSKPAATAKVWGGARG